MLNLPNVLAIKLTWSWKKRKEKQLRFGIVRCLVTASVAVDGPGLEVGCTEKLKLGTAKRAHAKLLVKVQPSCSGRPQQFGDAGIME